MTIRLSFATWASRGTICCAAVVRVVIPSPFSSGCFDRDIGGILSRGEPQPSMSWCSRTLSQTSRKHRMMTGSSRRWSRCGSNCGRSCCPLKTLISVIQVFQKSLVKERTPLTIWFKETSLMKDFGRSGQVKVICFPALPMSLI